MDQHRQRPGTTPGQRVRLISLLLLLLLLPTTISLARTCTSLAAVQRAGVRSPGFLRILLEATTMVWKCIQVVKRLRVTLCPMRLWRLTLGTFEGIKRIRDAGQLLGSQCAAPAYLSTRAPPRRPFILSREMYMNLKRDDHDVTLSRQGLDFRQHPIPNSCKSRARVRVLTARLRVFGLGTGTGTFPSLPNPDTVYDIGNIV